ncbi:hypothetical protein [Actinospica robiniae]|uniref:hypothetical protein n=1 Tax=Actinospica robiniae TaxID=304901 RepID=UPI0003F4C3DF|nr:hypothetical protein [Actinospica robiniae]
MFRQRNRLLAGGALAAIALGLCAGPAAAAVAPDITTIASTVPGNGDVNPYGVAVVPDSIGALQRGNVLVSNFNNKANQQGTGRTIVQITPKGRVSTFAYVDPRHLPGRCPGGVGLTTALSVLRSGWVIVGSLPTKDGTSATAKAGCLLVLDSRGKVRETIAGWGINGPWDMTAADYGDHADLFVTNVLNGTVAGNGAVVRRGTVLRIALSIAQRGYGLPRPEAVTVIGSGFPERTDPNALVVGPTGVGLSNRGTLYVADTAANRIAAIPDALKRTRTAGTGSTVTRNGHLNGPLGLTTTRRGTILTVNGGDGNLVSITPNGTQGPPVQLDDSGTPAGAGALFGIALKPRHGGLYFVDDADNTLKLLHRR